MLWLIIIVTGLLSVLLDDEKKKRTFSKVHKVFCWITIGILIFAFFVGLISAM